MLEHSMHFKSELLIHHDNMHTQINRLRGWQIKIQTLMKIDQETFIH